MKLNDARLMIICLTDNSIYIVNILQNFSIYDKIADAFSVHMNVLFDSCIDHKVFSPPYEPSSDG